MSTDPIGMPPRRAVMFTPMETRRRLIVDVAVRAEQLGYDAVIVPEGWGLDSSVVLAEIATRTTRIDLVAGLVSIWGRTPATVAMTSATLHDLSGGRFVLGLGASTPTLAERFHGQSFAAPAARLEAFVQEVRRLLGGERATTTSTAPGLRLGQDACPDLRIWIGGIGPRTVGIARSEGDAWFPALLPRDRIRRTRLDERLPDEDAPAPPVACGPITGVDTDSFEAGTAIRQMIGWYLTGMGPFYGDAVAASGFGTEVAALRAANPRPTPLNIRWPDTAEPLVDQLGAAGDPAEVGRQVRTWDGVADLVTVGLLPAPADAIMATVDAAAPTTDPSGPRSDPRRQDSRPTVAVGRTP